MAHTRSSSTVSRSLALLLSSMPATAQGCTCVSGSGVEARQSFALEGFDRIESEGVFDVWITVGQPFSVEAVADDNIMPMARVTQRGRTLKVDAKGGISSGMNPRVEVSMPTLREAELGSDGRIVGLSGGTLRVKTTPVTDLELQGTLDTLELVAEDDVDGRGLTTRVAHLELGSYANVELGVTEELRAWGRGKLRYTGSPTVLDIASAIEVTRR